MYKCSLLTQHHVENGPQRLNYISKFNSAISITLISISHLLLFQQKHLLEQKLRELEVLLIRTEFWALLLILQNYSAGSLPEADSVGPLIRVTLNVPPQTSPATTTRRSRVYPRRQRRRRGRARRPPTGDRTSTRCRQDIDIGDPALL